LGIKGGYMTEKRSALNKEFKVGDVAVYPAHGVGEVQSIETREIAGNKHKFYILKILDSGMTIMVPTGNVRNVGLREVINESETDIVYDILRERDISINEQTWNRRYREYMDKIKTGSIYEIAEVMRDLMLLRYEKELSFGERKMLDTARYLIVKELAISQDMAEDEIADEIDEIFAN
jgi:CarD family transcriptional regulator